MVSLEGSTPPLFRRGASLTVRFLLLTLLALSLLLLDLRQHHLQALRQAAHVVTDPLHRLVQWPAYMAIRATHYLEEFDAYLEHRDNLRSLELNISANTLRLDFLKRENDRLRKLLKLPPRILESGQMLKILSSTRDPFRRRITLNQKPQSPVAVGSPVIDEHGLIGQVTNVFHFSAEVRLVTDSLQMVPVQILRNGLRTLLHGQGRGLLDLRYLSQDADVLVGDLLVTSGLDGVYPPGLPVARVSRVEMQGGIASFIKVLCEPVASVDHYDHVMVLPPRSRPRRGNTQADTSPVRPPNS